MWLGGDWDGTGAGGFRPVRSDTLSLKWFLEELIKDYRVVGSEGVYRLVADAAGVAPGQADEAFLAPALSPRVLENPVGVSSANQQRAKIEIGATVA
jgi:hypothetical protein